MLINVCATRVTLIVTTVVIAAVTSVAQVRDPGVRTGSPGSGGPPDQQQDVLNFLRSL